MIASHCSGAPKEKPTFLKEQAMPRPRRMVVGEVGNDWKGERWAKTSTVGRPGSRLVPQPAACAAASITSAMLTPGGMGVCVVSRLPSRKTFLSRSSTGSMPSASASLFIWHSAANAPCGPPKPRNAPPGTLLVVTA